MLFAFSKIAWSLLAPGSLLTLLLVLGLYLAASPRPDRAALGRRIGTGVAAVFLLMVLTPVGEWALTPLENRFAFAPPAHVDGIIMLGGDEQARITEARGQPTALDSMRRAVTFAALARDYPDARLVFSGGPLHPRPAGAIIDSDVARQILAEIGLPVDRVIFEKTSRNTWENAVNSAVIVRPQPNETWLLVTSAWHMPRAMGCFRQAGWNVAAAPTGYFTAGDGHARFLFRFDEQMHMLTMALHEYAGLIAYRLLGRTNALWPG